MMMMVSVTVVVNGFVDRNLDRHVLNHRIWYALVNGERNRLLDLNRYHLLHRCRYFFLYSLYDRLDDLKDQ